jgi:hypothetical protein
MASLDKDDKKNQMIIENDNNQVDKHEIDTLDEPISETLVIRIFNIFNTNYHLIII